MLLLRCGKQFQFKLPALLTFCLALGTLISVNKSPMGTFKLGTAQKNPTRDTSLRVVVEEGITKKKLTRK